MSAVPAIENKARIDVLSPPFDSWSPDELLNYFKTRKGIKYFAVANEAEVSREKIDNILNNVFDFNEESYQFSGHLDWLNNPSTDIEWSIMWHKFYYAVGLGIAFKETGDQRYAKKWVELTSSWINTVSVNFLPSDVTGRRIQNWVFAHYYFVSECLAEAVTPDFYVEFLMSIHQQVSYLCGHLTPARNHRTLELYTIFLVAVVFPELKDADYWLKFSTAELLKNVQTDILSDGVHCELSTDYHHIVLRNLLAVRRLATMNDIALPNEMDDYIKKALEYSIYVHKPDGTIPSLSDGDTGCFLSLLEQGYELYGCEEMRYVFSKGKQGNAPAKRSKAFPAGGYYIMRSGWGDKAESYQDERYLIFDCGDLGAGNHGHLDLLSFEMAAYGQSLIVDPGRYTYDEAGDTNWRVLFRGTGYHNTVMVDGLNQTRYEFHKEKFKIKGLQPKYELKAFHNQTGFDYLHGVAHSHEYPVVHERKIVFVNGEYWLICDVLRAEESHHYEQLFHLSVLAQDKVSLHEDLHAFTITSPNLIMVQPKNEANSVSVEDGYVSPAYGIKQAAPIVKFSQAGAECCFYTVLYPYKEASPTLSVSTLTVNINGRNCKPHEAACLSIEIQAGEEIHRDLIFVTDAEGDYKIDTHTFKNPVFYERRSGQGQLLSQFDLSALELRTGVQGNCA
jgi:uncharacterized heparinase superfamily protein